MRFFILIFSILLLCNVANSAPPQRLALVIGNSKYANLGVLENTANDARSVDKSLREMGYKTKMLMDADEMMMRKTIKQFASESINASISLVFYAGHGAQINGENFLLPTDMEVPKRESDIQLSALKVDDIVNSLKSKTKVIFLDACRDNPALTKSLSKGRGSFRGGLAAAKTSSYEDTGSLFIAYATDSGNVAQDGEGQKNSPFTTALLKYIKQPVSIDDMFSLVTREVRLATKNAQKPYKYASLEGVICLAEMCGSVRNNNQNFQAEQIESIENQDYRIASSSNDSLIISNFIDKYPDHEKISEMSLKLAQIGWGWTEPLVLVDFNHQVRSPLYLMPSTIKMFEQRRMFDVKWIFEDRDALSKVDRDYAYHIHSYVINCKEMAGAGYQTKAYDKGGKLIHDTQVGDPRYIKLDIDLSNTAELGNSFLNLVCKPETLMPLTSKEDLDSGSWERLYSINQDVDYFKNKSSVKRSGDTVDVLVKYVFKKPKIVSQLSLYNDDKLYVKAAAGYKNVPIVRSVVIHDRFDCKNQTLLVIRQRFFDEANNYVGIENFPLKGVVPSKVDGDRLSELIESVCK